MCLHVRFFVRGKRPQADNFTFDLYLGDAETIGVARERAELLKEQGYTGVEIYERPLPRKVE